MAATGLRAALKQERERTAGRIFAGLVLGALVYALVFAFAFGASGLLWAGIHVSAETNSEAAAWAIAWALIGGVIFAPLGAVMGFVHRIWGVWIRRPWILPVIGLLAGSSAALAFDEIASWRAPLILWPIIGFVSGITLHQLFAGLVGDR